MQNHLGLNKEIHIPMVSSYLLESLPSVTSGYVHSVFKNSFNLMLENQLVHIGSIKETLSCIGCTLAQEVITPVLEEINVGDIVTYKKGRIQIYNRTQLFDFNLEELSVFNTKIPVCSRSSLLLEELKKMDLGSLLGIEMNHPFLQVQPMKI